MLKRLGSDLDALVLSECWLSEYSHIPQLSGYNVYFTKKRINKCGGVVIYIKDSWSVTVQEPIFEDTNCLIINVADYLKIVGIYRSPAVKDLKAFNDSLENVLHCTKDQATVLVTGDMNINLLEEYPSSGNEEYQSIMAEHGFLPAITEATRKPTMTCLDHAFVKTKNKALGLICNCAITDHNLVLVGLSADLKHAKVKKRVVTKSNFQEVATELRNVDWKEVLNTDDVNDAVHMFSKTVTDCIHKHSRMHKISRSKFNLKPWITPGLIRCMRHRDNLHLKLRRDPENENLKTTYTRYKNFFNKLLRDLKAEYDNAQLSLHQGDSKNLWKTIKNVCDLPVTRGDAQELLRGATNTQDVLKECNKHFACAGANLAAKILGKLNTTQEALRQRVPMDICNPNSLFFAPTDSCEINGIIQDLKPDSAPGYDAITPRILKYAKAALVEPIVHICNLSMESGIFPDCWKTAVIIPVHKGGDKTSPDNYRPISLLSIISKILEKVVNKRLVNFLQKYELLDDHQFGFRQGKSTEDAIQHLVETVASHLDSGRKCVGVFLDLAKAFDTVSIPILLRKLERLGIRGISLEWFTSYLSNRRQCTQIGNLKSCELHIAFGVPQGSILAPTLFVVYMDAILKLKLPNADIICYADDTVAIFHGVDWNSAFEEAEGGMAALSQWLDTNLLTLNISKTNFVAFNITQASGTDRSQLQIHSKNCRASVGKSRSNFICSCNSIDRVEFTKYLGVMVDQNLSFKKHITYISKKARKMIYIMKTLRSVTNEDVKRMVYICLCQSLFQYCVGVWGGAAKTHMEEVERAQRALLKVLLGKARRYPTDKLYKEASVLTVRQLFVLRAVIKTHNLSNPQALNRRKRTRMRNLSLPKIYSIFASRLPKYVHIFTYNAVCNQIDIVTGSVSEVKHKTREWLFSLTYIQTEKLVKYSEVRFKDVFPLGKIIS